MPYLMRIIIF